MKYFVWILLTFLILGAVVFAQQKTPPPPKIITDVKPSLPKLIDNSSPDAYLFSDADHAKMRDLQYQGDQLTIQNKTLELEIETIAAKDPEIVKRRAQIADNKAQQAKLLDQMLNLAAKVANERKINLDLYQLDAVQMKFAKKGPAKK